MAEARTLIAGKKEIVELLTPERLTTSSGITGLLIRAEKTNKAFVRVGPQVSVAATGYKLEAGESLQFDFLDPSTVFVAGTEGDEVSFVGTVP